MRDLACVLIAAAALCLTGCASTRVELDKMTDTAFPPDGIAFNGETVTLASIYEAETLVVNLVKDDDNIPAILSEGLDKCPPICGGGGSDPDPTITVAELHSFEEANRNPIASPVGESKRSCGFLMFTTTCTEYHVYGAVVNYYLADDRDRRVGQKAVMGQMFTLQNRRSFAMFFRNESIRNRPDAYLIALAHEVGHGFNLHHEDAIQVGDRTDIMYPDVSRSVPRFVSPLAKDHLRNHERECVFPGKSAFGAHHLGHNPDHVKGAKSSCQHRDSP